MNQRTIPSSVAWVAAMCTGCASYQPAPLEPDAVLEHLQAMKWPGETASQGSPADGTSAAGAGPRELAAFAVSTNPELAARRAELGVRQALLVEAGLLPDPEIGWDAMDVLAAQMIEGDSTAVDTLAGFGLMFPLLRPGEGQARVDAATWRSEEARQVLVAAEWTLTREIHLAYEEVRAAEGLLAQTRTLTELARSTSDYFQRAREAGAATAIQSHLALGELQTIRRDTIRAESRVRQARQALNGLLGLPPRTELELGASADPSSRAVLQWSPDDLLAHAVVARPDLSAVRARYQAAEEDVKLAVSKQYPQVALGTGIRVLLPFFSRFGRPERETALARREQVRREYTAAVHAARQEIAAAHARWKLARREVELVESELLPNAEQTLALSEEAFRAGEVTLFETLALQRALVEARTQRTEVRAELAQSSWALLAASGWLLDPEPGENKRHEEDSP